MKVFVPVEKRTFICAPGTYLEIFERIKNNGKFTCKIDGKSYYFAEMKMIQNDLIEAVFVSNNAVEIEVTNDE